MKELKGKNILLLAPNFFGYEFEIKKELENLGAKVFYFDERPKNDFLTKACIRLNLKSFIQKNINNYYQNIVNETKTKNFDYLFLISPETIDVEKIKKIKSLHLNIKVFIYIWDSIKNKIKSLDLLPFSDKFFTFDLNDKVKNKCIKFLPLFYIRDYAYIENKDKPLYDISFIGTIHSDRYSIVKSIDNSKFSVFAYFYSPSKVLFLLQKILHNEFKKVSNDDVSFKSLNKKEIINIIENSKCIIDIEHPLQQGLTMRTIEMLGARKKLITTNKNIKEYDFYNTKNICIVDRDNPIISKDFLKLEYSEIEQNIYEKYTLQNWIKNIFKAY
jgi:hypothetical protein